MNSEAELRALVARLQDQLDGLGRRLANREGAQIGSPWPHDRALSCPTCSDVIAFFDTRNGEVRGGYRSEFHVRFVPAGTFTVLCKRCSGHVEFSSHGVVLDMLQLAGRRPGDPLDAAGAAPTR